MAIFKCKMCGGSLDINEGVTVTECEYCGTKQTLPKTNDDVISNLFNRANNLRLKCEFDKAEDIYEKILQTDETQAEAYWGLILCKYGIEYVEDPKTFTRIPTCHRTSFDSIIADEDYKSALKYADGIQRGIYEAEAKEIDRIQKEILALSQKEEPYDVFICYKETDSTGKRTQDSVIANDIYYQLTQEGFKVFYAAITLEDKLGSAYEPCIFAALNSAKVMLSIGTKPEYFNAVWVKNEWARFLKMMKKDRSKMLIPCYKDMDAYELPEEFAHLQAQDMSKIGFVNDVVRGIKKVVQTDEQKATVVKETVISGGNTNTEPLLKRAFMFLEDGDWNSANEYCEKVLDLDPENAEAYLGKLMAELRVKTQEALKNCAEPFDDRNNYQKAVRFADNKLKAFLGDVIQFIIKRNEDAAREETYNRACNLMNLNSESGFTEAVRWFAKVPGYKDADILAEECREKAEIARKDGIYNLACKALNKKDPQLVVWDENEYNLKKYKQALTQFQTLDGWRDSLDKIKLCEEKIKETETELEKYRIEKEKEELERQRQEEIKRIEAEKRAKRNKKIALITTPIVCTIIAFIIVLNTVIIPNQAGKTRLANIKSQLNDIKVGSYIKFGEYEQDNNTSNGKEDIEWLVLEVKDGNALIISKYALECKKYNTRYKDITWETCTLRKWLNNGFFSAAFSAYEKAIIPTVKVSADKNPKYNTNPGKATHDKVFLLSITEANKYFSSDSARQCKSTDFAVANGTYKDNCNWWLRSPGYDQLDACIVSQYGTIHISGDTICGPYTAVRPAMWIDLSDV